MTKKIEETFNPIEKIINIQKSICGLKKDAKNPFHKSTYMNLSTIVNALKPILYENECYSSHELGLSESEKPFLTTKIIYKDGTVLLQCKSPLPVKDAGDPQKLGSAITYMRRYNLTALLEIEEDDDDGQKATKPAVIEKINANQLKELQEALDKANKNIIDFCKSMKIGSLSDLVESKFDGVIKRLNEIADANSK
jgi:hypothetical protein